MGGNGFLTALQLCVEVLLPQLRRRTRDIAQELGTDGFKLVEEQLRAAGFHALRLAAALLVQSARLPSGAEEVVALLLQLSGPTEQLDGIDQLYGDAKVCTGPVSASSRLKERPHHS